MTRLVLMVLATALATPAVAQSFDPAAQRLEMERVRAQTELNAASASAYRAQSNATLQQLQATTRNDGGVAAAVAADTAARAEARRQEELRRQEAEAIALEVERRIRAAGGVLR